MVFRLLIVLSFLELGILGLMLMVLFAHAYWVTVRIRATQEKFIQLRRDASVILGTSGLPVPVEFQKNSRLNRRVLAEMASSVSGEARTTITETAEKMGLLSEAERRCKSYRWWIRLRGVREFTLYGGGEDIVPAHLDDPKSDVRAAATGWSAEHISDVTIRRVVSMLDDPVLHCRYVAEDTLNRMGNPVVAPLDEYLARKPTASRAIALRVATRFADPRFLGASLTSAADADPTVRVCSATLLAAITGSRAEQELLQLLDDTDEAVRVAAVRGLGRIRSWKFSPDIARLLHDPAWEVRSSAALALHQIGPGGRLYLRRSLQDEDTFAADIARQVLDLPNE